MKRALTVSVVILVGARAGGGLTAREVSAGSPAEAGPGDLRAGPRRAGPRRRRPVRRRALRRRRARPPPLLRPQPGRPRRQRALVRRLPHGDRPLPALARRTPSGGSSSCSGGAGSIRDADDPLFRPIDADDFRTNGEDASDFSNLRQNGLVRVSFPLPREHEARRSRDERAVRARPSWTCGAPCRPSTT